jgi:hypothetical protein
VPEAFLLVAEAFAGAAFAGAAFAAVAFLRGIFVGWFGSEGEI